MHTPPYPSNTHNIAIDPISPIQGLRLLKLFRYERRIYQSLLDSVSVHTLASARVRSRPVTVQESDGRDDRDNEVFSSLAVLASLIS